MMTLWNKGVTAKNGWFLQAKHRAKEQRVVFRSVVFHLPWGGIYDL